MITKHTMYKASDGSYHTSRDAAIHHEQQIDLESYLNENPIFSHYGINVDGQDFMTWLTENPRIFVQLLPEKGTTAEPAPEERI